MIGQFLSNTNESATVSILQNFLELNKALVKFEEARWQAGAPRRSQCRCRWGLEVPSSNHRA